jgi:oxygen-independent coproporphyrinogen-3 oxidase
VAAPDRPAAAEAARGDAAGPRVPEAEPLGLYVHIPFCEAKCAYCHFAIDPLYDDLREERYLRALLTEIVASEPARPADTIYFGGGTPSLFTLPRLCAVLDALSSRFRILPDPEITLEANPRDQDREGYRALRRLGVNRLSLGLQSLDDAVLREMGRLHDAADGLRAFEDARAAGFDNLSVDLVLGWPGETRDRWSPTRDRVIALGPEHVSLYVLEVERKTALAHRLQRGGLALPDDDVVADLYEETAGALRAAGLERYEISNFARPGFASRHNRKYWDDAPFLGFGLSAHSHFEGRRFWNLDTFGGYCRAVEEKGPTGARAGERRPSPRERAGEALFTGLRRREGIDLAAFARRYGLDPLAEFARDLADPFAAGLIAAADGRLRLTERGVMLSNEVFRAFVD